MKVHTISRSTCCTGYEEPNTIDNELTLNKIEIMGTWGTHFFDNDIALDWLAEFLEWPTDDNLLATFTFEVEVINPTFFGKLLGEKPQTVQALLQPEEIVAAAAVVTALRGRPVQDAKVELGNLPQVEVADSTVQRAIEAIDQVLKEATPEPWKELDDFDDWLHRVDDLKKRLQSLI